MGPTKAQYLIIFLSKMSERIKLERAFPVGIVHVDGVGVDDHIRLIIGDCFSQVPIPLFCTVIEPTYLGIT